MTGKEIRVFLILTSVTLPPESDSGMQHTHTQGVKLKVGVNGGDNAVRPREGFGSEKQIYPNYTSIHFLNLYCRIVHLGLND